MKKLFALSLALVLALSLAACGGNGGNGQTADKETPAKDFEWVEASGGIEITGYKGSSTTVVVPEIIENKKVVKIADSAFSGNVVIESVTLPEGVTNVSTAFINCDNLICLKAPGVNKVDRNMFLRRPQSLVELDFSNATAIEYLHLMDCSNLKKLNIPSVVRFENTYGNRTLFSQLESIAITEENFKYYCYYGGGDESHALNGLEYENGKKDFIGMLCAGNDPDKYYISSLASSQMREYKFHEITGANRAQVFCDFFGMASITVNGTEYTK